MTDQIENITIGVSVQTRETRYSYDAMGDVTQEIDAYGTSLAATTITDYDVNGHLTEEIDPSGNTTLFKYDASGNETWTQNAMGYTSTMQYDGNNHLTSEVDADGRLQTFTYNAQGLETGNVWFAGSTTSGSVLQSISFGYDANGNETFASDNSGAYTLSYNPLGQVTKVIEPVGGGVTLSMGYDGSGNRTLLEDSTGGTILSTYDTANELTTEIYTQTGVSGALRIDQSYDWLGRVVEQERYSDAAGTTLIATASYEYNSAGQITDLNDDAAGTLIASYSLGYDGAGELTQQTINGTMTTLTYDQLGELTSGDSTSQTYTSSGNRTTDTTIAGNEVTYDGTFSYAYDPQGNETLMYDTTTDTTWAYTYDNDNHMTEAVETVSSTTVMEADYQYDAFGNMTEEEVITYGSPNTTAISEYVIDSFNPAHAGATGQSGSNVLADLNGGGTLMTHYVWGDGIDQLFGRYDAGGTLTADPAGIYGTMTDQNGSVCDVIDNTGTLQVAVQYDAWGNILTVTGPGMAPLDPQYYLGDFTYDTYDYDAATGYYDVNARVYSSASGRWLSQDPMGFDAGDSNLYRYVNNSPMDRADPSGMYETDVHFEMTYFLAVSAGLNKAILGVKNPNGVVNKFDYAFLVAWADEQTDRSSFTSPIRNILDPGKTRKYHFSVPSDHFHEQVGNVMSNLTLITLTGGLAAASLLFDTRPTELVGIPTPVVNSVVKDSPWAISNFMDAEKNQDPFAAGIALHSYQDSWSHEGFGISKGHADEPYGGHAPDYPWCSYKIGGELRNGPAYAMEMAKKTWGLLRGFASKLGLKVPPPNTFSDVLKPILQKLFSEQGSPRDINAYNKANPAEQLAMAANTGMWERETAGRVQNWKDFMNLVAIKLGQAGGWPNLDIKFGDNSPLNSLFKEAARTITDPNDFDKNWRN